MTFNTDPNLYEYQGAPWNCPLCFDPGQTSKSLFLCFSGIKIGTGWLPGDPEPPNGSYEVSAIGPCTWQGFHDGYTFDYQTDPLGSLIRAWTFPAPVHFTQTSLAGCTSYFLNALINPAGVWFGGFALVVAPLPGGAYDITNMVKLLGMEPGPNLWVNPRPIAANRSVHALFSNLDSISVLIKVEN